MNNRPNWQRDLAWIKAVPVKKSKRLELLRKLDNFSNEPELSSERGLQNKREFVFNILVINVKASAHHICTRCDCWWQISQTCYLSSPQLAFFFFFVLGFLFCWEVTEGLIKKAGNSSILKKAPVQPWQSAHGFRPTRTWPAVSPHTPVREQARTDTHTHRSYHHANN